MLYYLSYIILICFNIIKNKKALHVLQQNLYNTNNRYIKWLNKNKKKIFLNLELLAFLLIILSFLLKKHIVFIIISLIIYILEGLYLCVLNKLDKVKINLVVTKRLIRLIVTLSIIYLLPLFFPAFVSTII